MIRCMVERRRNHLIAWPDACGDQRDMKRRCTCVRGNHEAVLKAEEVGDPVLELFCRGSHTEPANIECVRQVFERIDANCCSGWKTGMRLMSDLPGACGVCSTVC